MGVPGQLSLLVQKGPVVGELSEYRQAPGRLTGLEGSSHGPKVLDGTRTPQIRLIRGRKLEKSVVEAASRTESRVRIALPKGKKRLAEARISEHQAEARIPGLQRLQRLRNNSILKQRGPPISADQQGCFEAYQRSPSTVAPAPKPSKRAHPSLPAREHAV